MDQHAEDIAVSLEAVSKIRTLGEPIRDTAREGSRLILAAHNRIAELEEQLTDLERGFNEATELEDFTDE